MSWFRRLDARLFVSFALVALGGAAVALLAIRLVAPSIFEHEVGMMDGALGSHRGPAVHDAFDTALGTASWVALAAGLIVAGVVAALVARRILRPLDAVREAAGRIAAGRYDEPVPLPQVTELAALAADVNSLAETLKDSETRRARLVSEVAHELRTPLTTIDGYVQGALDGVFEPNEEMLVAVSEEVARLERLANDLSALSRAEEGKLELQPVDADVGELATRVAERLRPQFDDKAVTLEITSTSPVPVHVDSERITQVLTNLLGNALTYTSPGGRVTVEARIVGGHASVAIADTGRGLRAEELAHVFERFYRVPGVPRPPGGSGIGLTIARSITRAHDGDITAASAGPGRGATFTVHLPLRG